MEYHELLYWHPATLAQQDHGGGVPVQLSDHPCNLVLADLQSIYQIVFTTHPYWHKIDELGNKYAICNHLSCFETGRLADLLHGPCSFVQLLDKGILAFQDVFSGGLGPQAISLQ